MSACVLRWRVQCQPHPRNAIGLLSDHKEDDKKRRWNIRKKKRRGKRARGGRRIGGRGRGGGEEEKEGVRVGRRDSGGRKRRRRRRWTRRRKSGGRKRSRKRKSGGGGEGRGLIISEMKEKGKFLLIGSYWQEIIQFGRFERVLRMKLEEYSSILRFGWKHPEIEWWMWKNSSDHDMDRWASSPFKEWWSIEEDFKPCRST